MASVIRPYQWVAVRLPSDTIKLEQMIPNSSIYLGKFGSFRTNQVINRPFNLTWEIIEHSAKAEAQGLRIVRASELHADAMLEEAETDLLGDSTPNPEFDEYGTLSTEKSNVNIVDDPANQKLTMQEIEDLKENNMSNPKELIEKIMASHSSLDQKTAFSLAKYIMRKQKKFLKRFTILPLDVSTMTDWMMEERDFSKVMEIRNEVLSLMCSWVNIHVACEGPGDKSDQNRRRSRYLVIDDTGGLVVAALAERLGILHHNPEQGHLHSDARKDTTAEAQDLELEQPVTKSQRSNSSEFQTSNTLHLIHSNQQPNLALLRYFNFDPNIAPSSTNSTPPHPLYTHLKTMSWLQLLDPNSDSTYQEPPPKAQEELHTMKSNARSAYYRKRRRWERCKTIVDEVRLGGFDGLVIASYTNPLSMLHHLVPLLAGAAQIVVYSPYVEPLLEVADAYSTARRTAFLNLEEEEREASVKSAKFPVDPTLTLGFTLQTARIREWQVLPGRTHPLMTGRGGAECFIAVATRVLPVKGKVQARGNQQGRFRKKKLTEEDHVLLVQEDAEERDNSSGDEQPEGKKVKITENGLNYANGDIVGTTVQIRKENE